MSYLESENSFLATRIKVNAATTAIYEELMRVSEKHQLSISEMLLALTRIQHELVGDLVKLEKDFERDDDEA